ncbi:CRISPR-associated protein Csm2 [Candidatus Kryptonium thompsonii]|uniref:CRISPR system Cms protein Csm2 n=1 Tax=Candidatus Kryptonium thompsonii TaxID=1633631 RepID=A0A0P1LL50_9BACT|nr:type III-A CRISPR-associated protein Csm2 [Candidatus Kryptonium thompsoni]CUS82465.1 CRISPR-associated protein Csm2 [Candidatus Kryptonium thompsoni]CUS82715.1 CRISPR-associated protein Csm2 [Candidatus Kryptonium thompsoni]CUS83250.1 CRISPR-associated protein Csm2 [Candidatus Kryptonium thompsoni]CUS87539.1 CRISPR-associated protein Csm2 [Candidatus Kryptonium thompsoni]CUS91152.1 CRISPR-associated protein Csm2 [Candidatus Kryptonium thompsoni]
MAEEKYFLRKTSDDKWVIKEEMVTTKAEKWADEFIGRDPRKPELKSAQLRKFYNEVRALADRVEVEGFEKVKPLIKMLKVKVNYQKGRKLVPEKFVDFITECVDQVNDKEDFLDGFVKHFEAVVGYYYGKAEKFD